MRRAQVGRAAEKTSDRLHGRRGSQEVGSGVNRPGERADELVVDRHAALAHELLQAIERAAADLRIGGREQFHQHRPGAVAGLRHVVEQRDERPFRRVRRGPGQSDQAPETRGMFRAVPVVAVLPEGRAGLCDPLGVTRNQRQLGFDRLDCAIERRHLRPILDVGG